MPRPASKLLTPPEWKVMNIVWSKKACSARDVYLRAGELYSWAPNTVRTHLNRLVNKGFLKAVLIGNSYLYRPKKTLPQILCQVADDLLEKAQGEQEMPLLVYMVQKSYLSADDVKQLGTLLKRVGKMSPPQRE